MRRSRRILLDGLAVFAALVCVLAAVAWAVNTRRDAVAAYEGRRDTFGVVATEGALCPFHMTHGKAGDGLSLDLQPIERGPLLLRPSETGPSPWVPVWVIRDPQLTAVIVADWFLILAGGGLAAWRLRGRRAAARRAGGGRCRTCGYDLRATPERCPECGAVATAAPPPAEGK